MSAVVQLQCIGLLGIATVLVFAVYGGSIALLIALDKSKRRWVYRTTARFVERVLRTPALWLGVSCGCVAVGWLIVVAVKALWPN